MAEVSSTESRENEPVPVLPTERERPVDMSEDRGETGEGNMEVVEAATEPGEKPLQEPICSSNMDEESKMDSGEDVTCSSVGSVAGCAEETSSSGEGEHMKRLIDALSRTVKRCIHAGRTRTFAEKYRCVYKQNPKALKQIVEQYKQHLQDSIQTETELLLSEENLPALFQKFEEILVDPTLQQDSVAWRPSGQPEEDLRSHRMAAKLKEKEELQKRLQVLEYQTACLKKPVLQARQKLLNTQRSLQAKMETFSEAAAACDACPTEHISNLMNDMQN